MSETRGEGEEVVVSVVIGWKGREGNLEPRVIFDFFRERVEEKIVEIENLDGWIGR